MLVSATEIINKAHEGHYAIGAFNTNNLEWTKSLLKAAQDAKAPIIIQTSEGAAKYMGGFKMVVDIIRDLHDSMGITVPVALHLDHGTYEGAKKCIELGYTSVMFDGSHYPIEENIAKVSMKTLAKYGVVSGESGGVGLGTALEIIKNNVELKEKLGINENSVMLFVNTEGDTDKENYQKILAEKE